MPTNELAQAKSAMNLDRVRLIMLDSRMARTGNSLVNLNKMLDRISIEARKQEITQRIEKLEDEQENINARMHNILKKYNVHNRQRGYMAVWHKEYKLYFTVKFTGEDYPFKTNETSQVQEG